MGDAIKALFEFIVDILTAVAIFLGGDADAIGSIFDKGKNEGNDDTPDAG